MFLNIYLVNLPLLYLPLPVSFLLLYVFLLLVSSCRLGVSLVGGEFRIYLLQNPSWTTPLNFLSLLFHLCSLWSLSNLFFFCREYKPINGMFIFFIFDFLYYVLFLPMPRIKMSNKVLCDREHDFTGISDNFIEDNNNIEK